MFEKAVAHYPYHFPDKLPQRASLSALAIFATQLYFGSGLRTACFCGGLAAVASAVEATTRPLFAELLPENPLTRRVIAGIIGDLAFFTLVSKVAPLVGRIRFQALPPLLSIVAWLIFNENIISKRQAVAVIL